jgi:hypothetical protein
VLAKRAADRRKEFLMLKPCVETAAAPLKGFLSYVPEAQEIRDAALAAIIPVKSAASRVPEAPQEAEGERTRLAVSSGTSDDWPVAVMVSPLDETPAVSAPQETRPTERTAVAETPGPDSAADRLAPPAELEETASNVLAHVRLLVASDQQQQEARAAACRAEEAWVQIRYSTTAASEQVKMANRARLAARRAFAQAWEEYIAASQALCRSAAGLVEQEGPAGQVIPRASL